MSGLLGPDGAPLARPELVPSASPTRSCVACACTEDHACLADDNEPCRWMVLIGDDAGLCSSCIQIAARVNDVLEQLQALGVVAGGAPERETSP